MSRTKAPSRKGLIKRPAACSPDPLSPVVRTLVRQVEELKKLLASAQGMLNSKSSLSLSIPEDVWEDTSNAGWGSEVNPHSQSRLHTSVTLNGLNLHCEAIEVYRDSGTLVTVDPELENWLSEIYEASGADGIMETLEIKGKRYVLFLTPHC